MNTEQSRSKELSKNTNRLVTFWYQHTYISIAIYLVLINFLLIFLFTIIIDIASEMNFIEAFKYCLVLTVLSSDGMGDDKTNPEYTIKIIMVLLQMVIFSGSLIGFATNIIQTKFDKGANHKGALKFKNHYVILNWSSIGANIIYDLSNLEGFKTVVILAEDDREMILNEISDVFSDNNRKMDNVRVFVKTGNPTSTRNLEDIRIDDAKCIGILLSNNWENLDTDISDFSNRDLNAFKHLMSIIHLVHNCNIVVELESHAMTAKIENLFDNIGNENNNTISAFSHNSVIGLILGKALCNPDYNRVYEELLSYEGVEFYSMEAQSVESALSEYNDCIPVVNFDDDVENDKMTEEERLEAEKPDSLYFLSTDGTHLGKRDKPLTYTRRIPFRMEKLEYSFTIFIVGSNNSLRYVEYELSDFREKSGSEIIWKKYSYDTDVKVLLEGIKSTKGPKKVLLLSNEDAQADIRDSQIFITILNLLINDEGFKGNKEIEVFTEISNPTNYYSIRNLGVSNVIITNRMISLFMIQLLTHSNARKFYSDLLSSNTDSNGGVIDIEIYKAIECLDIKEPLVFETKAELVQTFYYSSNMTKCILGYRKANTEPILYLCDDMDKKEKIVITPEDELILAEVSGD